MAAQSESRISWKKLCRSALIYIVGGLGVLIMHIGVVPEMFALIFKSAFGLEPVFAGIMGSTLNWGIKRGVYSNEAGQGSGAIMCAPTTSQYAAVEALRNGDEDVQHMRESYDQRRRFLINAFEEMHLDCFEPQGAFYMFPSIKRFGMTSEEFATRLLRGEKVGVVPGAAFGDCGEGFLRVSYAYSLKSLKEALSRIKRFVDRLDGKTE